MSLYVSKERKGDMIFPSLQACFDYVNQTAYEGEIFVKSGIYKEKIKVTLNHVKIIGLGKVVFTYDDYAGKLDEKENIIGTTNSASFTLLEGSFNVEFSNIIFENAFIDSGKSQHTQAVAYKGLGDQIVYKNCSFLGKQDTLYLDEGRHYLMNCYIEGTVDFIFGGAVALFENCVIKSLYRDGRPLGYITAARTNHNKEINKHPYGFVFNQCQIISDIDIKKVRIEENLVYLGRPWRKGPSVLFMNSYLGNHISLLGWCDMKDNRYQDASFFEFNNYGEGCKSYPRRKQLTYDEGKCIDFNAIFNHDSFSRKWEKNEI